MVFKIFLWEEQKFQISKSSTFVLPICEKRSNCWICLVYYIELKEEKKIGMILVIVF